MRPFADTDMVANHCQAPAASVFRRRGVLQVTPPSVLRTNMTSSGSVPVGSMELTTYSHPAVGPLERSAQIQTCPRRPPGLGLPDANSAALPPMSMSWAASNTGAKRRSLAFVDFITKKCAALLGSTPTTYTLPSGATSRVPSSGFPGSAYACGNNVPPFVERPNVFVPETLPAVRHVTYTCPLPMLEERSTLIHSLSPPNAYAGGEDHV